MATEPQYKSIRVSVDTHQRVHDLAARLGKSADETLQFLLGDHTVRIPAGPVLQDRWEEGARKAGLPLAEFVVVCVEGSMTYGAPPSGLQLVFEHVQALTRAAGVKPIPVNVKPTRPPGPSTRRAHP
ncbi:hypothetical protein ACFWBG_34765 [Nocardia salmonicida]|uniref:hypothetical protein n=1 Tax=Bacillati TaxID=1783272 RepID=UPI0035D9BD99